jgi:hypothetical protein
MIVLWFLFRWILAVFGAVLALSIVAARYPAHTVYRAATHFPFGRKSSWACSVRPRLYQVGQKSAEINVICPSKNPIAGFCFAQLVSKGR